MASPKYGGKVSTPLRYLTDILSLYGVAVKCMYGEREKILEVRDLNISFKTDSGIVNAIRGVI